MTPTRLFLGTLFTSVVVAFAVRPAAAQDPVKVAPEVYKVLLDNPRVRVLDVTLPPGGKSPMHSHPATIIYSLGASQARFTFPDGSTKDVAMKQGETIWTDGLSHAVENTGGTAARVLNVELKEPPPGAEGKPEHPMDPVKINAGKYTELFANSRVRVLEYRDKPGDKSVMHSHPDHVVYALGPLKRRFTFPDGKTADIAQEAGGVVFAKSETHAGENIGTTPTHVLIFELETPPQHPASAHADAASGFMAVNFRDVKWEKMHPELGSDSPEVSILRVDPKTKAMQLLIRTPAAMHVPKHWHSANETHTVISGTGTFECGSDRATLGPGSFNYMPSQMVHQAWTSAGFVVFITVDGAWDIHWMEGPPKASDIGVAPPPAK